MRDGGKGDKPRPIQDKEKFDSNWDRIFKEKDGSLTINVNPNEKIELTIDLGDIEGRN
jgi:hypothetical protein